jgi:hypothetical protein
MDLVWATFIRCGDLTVLSFVGKHVAPDEVWVGLMFHSFGVVKGCFIGEVDHWTVMGHNGFWL